MKQSKNDNFDKYSYYLRSVQSPKYDVEFFRDTYKEIRNKWPKTLSEDFCGTFNICCEWVKLDSKFEAVGVDLDVEPIHYGQSHNFKDLHKNQQERIHILNKNVLDKNLPQVDILAAMNFSYYLFKERKQLVKYFSNVHRRLNKKGIFIMDAFGGPACQCANEEETEHKDFSYYWDQDSYDPLTNYAQFYIHFKRKGEKKREKVFSYDWRMWSLPELKDILVDAGFSKVHIYWEDDNDGEFKKIHKGEEVEAWVAYLISEK